MLRQESSAVEQILSHLCSKEVYGDVTEWCEMRNDCVIVVSCPDCNETFTLNDAEYEELLRLSHEEPRACGIHPIV